MVKVKQKADLFFHRRYFLQCLPNPLWEPRQIWGKAAPWLQSKPVTASAQAIAKIGGDRQLSQAPGPPGSSAASPHPANARKPLPRSVPGQDHLLLSVLHSRRGRGTKGGAQLGLTVLAIVSLLFLRHPIRLLGFLARVLSFSPHPPSQSAAEQPPNEASRITSPSGAELA